jgi:leucyl/phenylalanyl-tRNA---protein transferase
MNYSVFPPVETADESGLLAIGGSFEPSLLIEAYSSGIFPWPVPEINEIPWFAPPQRALLFLKDLHLGKRNMRHIKSSGFSYRCNTAFRDVMIKCSEAHNRKYKNKSDASHASWITDEMIEAYCELHRLGHAHSIEVFLKDNLVGGIYGVSIGKFFAAESMFYRADNASKAALLCLTRILASQGGTFIDCQELTPHLSSLGGIEIPRTDFMKLLKDSINKADYIFHQGTVTNDISGP